jgi:hypothetical protein
MATLDAMQQANKELCKQCGKIHIDKIEVRNSGFLGLPPASITFSGGC